MKRLKTSPRRTLVLLVDELPDRLALNTLALSASGFDVVSAKDGAEAYRRVWQTLPDIIVTQLPMPHYDGWEFLNELKQSSVTRNIPVVALSGYVHEPFREPPQHEGFAALFTAPCLPDELSEGLRQILERKTHAAGW